MQQTSHLDIGCNSNPRNPFDASKLYGVDIIDLETNDFNYHKCNVIFDALPFPDSSFESISAFDFLEHVPRTATISNTGVFPFIHVMNEIYRVLKKGSFFAFTEHGLGPEGDPIFPLPWADNQEMSFLLPLENTNAILKEIGFQKIKIVETGDKYIAGYEKLIQKQPKSEKPTLGIHVIGGSSMHERSINSMRSIKENRTLPFEIVCEK